LKLANTRCHYDLRKYSFTNQVVFTPADRRQNDGRARFTTSVVEC